MDMNVSIIIRPVIGGFVVEYPKITESGVVQLTEIATSAGKAMRIAKDAVQEFSLIKKTEDEE